MAECVLSVRDACYRYDHTEVLRNLTLDVARQEFLCVLGPSGCGKSTLLKLLAGALQPTSGQIEVRGLCRTVYQQDGLFPWLTVRQNVCCSVERLPKKEQQEKIAYWIDLVGLSGFEDHYPHELSGGMRQRGQLARVLAGEADVLLMDEPFSGLDYQTRHRMRVELRNALEHRPSTVIFVTHDVEEAIALGDRVVLLTGRPTGIQKIFDVPAPRQPAGTSRLAGEMVTEIIQLLGIYNAPEQAAPRRERESA